MSDGECDEGSVWEGALFAAHHGLENLVVIVDFNKIQSLGRVEDILRLEPLAAKWRAFGWAADEIDGHDVKAIDDVLGAIPAEPGRPTCVVAHTVKGRGVSFMENNVLWHYRAADPDELRLALAEIDRDA
jgi:transketolase